MEKKKENQLLHLVKGYLFCELNTLIKAVEVLQCDPYLITYSSMDTAIFICCGLL